MNLTFVLFTNRTQVHWIRYFREVILILSLVLKFVESYRRLGNFYLLEAFSQQVREGGLQ